MQTKPSLFIVYYVHNIFQIKSLILFYEICKYFDHRSDKDVLK